MEKLLLHCCCAPDATAISRLNERFAIALTFYNPNVHPREEYDRRLAEMDKVTEHWDVPLLETPYDPERWDALTLAHRAGMERSERCRICYRMRLESTARLAKEKGFDRFGTVLTVSPHKVAGWILEDGEEIARSEGIPFLSLDLKRGGGFQHTLEWSKKLGIWRQNYCGCRYSLWQREEEERIREEYRARIQARLFERPPTTFLALLVREEGNVLLFPQGGSFDLPQGPVLPGESFKGAAGRIAKEHGFRVRDLRFAGVEEEIERGAKTHRIVLVHTGTFHGANDSFTGVWQPEGDENTDQRIIKNH